MSPSSRLEFWGGFRFFFVKFVQPWTEAYTGQLKLVSNIGIGLSGSVKTVYVLDAEIVSNPTVSSCQFEVTISGLMMAHDAKLSTQ
jgi:hypothetical protein